MKDNELLHTHYPDLFNDNEAADPALERLIIDLETVYTSTSRPANLSGQLMSTLEIHVEHQDTTSLERPYASIPERPQIRSLRERRQRSWQRGLSTLVAAVVIALVVSSLLLVLYQAHQPGRSRTGAPHSIAGLNRFLTIHMIDASTGWAQISNALIRDFAVMRTTDGGSHWQEVTPSQLATPVDDNLAKLYALDATTAWITDVLPLQHSQTEKYHGVLFRTTNAGRTWQSIALPHSFSDASTISDVQFLNAQVGWITMESRTGKGGVQTQYALWHTSDGGRTWSNVTSANPAGSRGYITFVDEKTWWLTPGIIQITPTGNSGRPVISVTHDAGITWQQHVLPVPAGVSFNTRLPALREKPQFFSARDGLLVVSDGDIVVYVTHDGGDTWQPTTPLQFHGVSKDDVYAAGFPVFADMNHGWIYEQVIPIAGKHLPTTNRLIITSDGGRHWTTVEVQMPGAQKGQTVSPDTVWSSWFNPDFVSAKAGWLMGYYSPSTASLPHSELFKTIDGGHTWKIVHFSVS